MPRELLPAGRGGPKIATKTAPKVAPKLPGLCRDDSSQGAGWGPPGHPPGAQEQLPKKLPQTGSCYYNPDRPKACSSTRIRCKCGSRSLAPTTVTLNLRCPFRAHATHSARQHAWRIKIHYVQKAVGGLRNGNMQQNGSPTCNTPSKLAPPGPPRARKALGISCGHNLDVVLDFKHLPIHTSVQHRPNPVPNRPNTEPTPVKIPATSHIFDFDICRFAIHRRLSGTS